MKVHPAPKKIVSETLVKALKVLDAIDESEHGLRLMEISSSLNVNKTTVSRFVNAFCAFGLLRRDPNTKMFSLGPRTVALAHSFLQRSNLIGNIKPLIDQHHSVYDVHIDVGLLVDEAMFVIYRRESRDTQSFRHFTSSKGLHYLATGKAALAFMPEKERLELIDRLPLERKTVRTITRKSDLIRELDAIRQRGYAVNDEEFISGLIAVGAPLINRYTARVMGGVSFDTSTERYTAAEFAKQFSAAVIQLAQDISSLLPIA
jgi:IclR family pca regulon transcriptional regulator